MHASASLPEDKPVRHIIDSKQSSFGLRVFSTGLLSAFGHDPKIAIRDFGGFAEFTPETSPQGGILNLRISANSLEVTGEMSEKDRDEINRRMRSEVLQPSEFPEIEYQCSRVTASGSGDRYWVVLKGELTLRGITKAMPVSAKVMLSANSLRATGEFTLRQSDFGIAPVTAAAGTIRIKDEISGSFDIVARQG